MTGRYLHAAVLLMIADLISGATPRTSQQPASPKGPRASLRKAEPNLHAPDLYSDKLRLQFCVVNLPGADSPASYIEAYYEVYFVPEAAFNEAIKKTVDQGSNLTSPTQFTDKILLGKGRFRIKHLATIDDRTHFEGPIGFRSKVADNLRTKFATVLTTFAVKIYDGKLKTPFYRSSFFMTHPFDDDPAQPGRAVPRDTLYTNFFITQKGDLFTSQWRRGPGDVTWHP
jgi:hypothetical protein